MSRLSTKDGQKLGVKENSIILYVYKMYNFGVMPTFSLIAYFNKVVSCCSHPVLLSHDSLAETKVTTSHHHVFVAHRNLRILSLPANGMWVLKQNSLSKSKS